VREGREVMERRGEREKENIDIEYNSKQE